jgi:hypothetical protein
MPKSPLDTGVRIVAMVTGITVIIVMVLIVIKAGAMLL